MTGSGPSLGILRYGVAPSFPAPHEPRVAARGRVEIGGPYGFVGYCSACPQDFLYSTLAIVSAVDRHIRRRHS